MRDMQWIFDISVSLLSLVPLEEGDFACLLYLRAHLASMFSHSHKALLPSKPV